MNPETSRRKFLAATAASGLVAMAPRSVLGGNVVAYGMGTLPAGIRSRFVCNGNGLTMHVLEAGFGGRDRPCVLLLHGFPELAYSWRKSDWGGYQKPGDFEKMQKSLCTRMLGCHLVDGAGHWVQQEQT